MRSEFPELVAVLRAEQSFDNALEAQRVKGWAVVKGFAVYDLYDCPEGEAYVGYRHWWNVNDDGAWCARASPHPHASCSLCSTTSRPTRARVETEGVRARASYDWKTHHPPPSLSHLRAVGSALITHGHSATE